LGSGCLLKRGFISLIHSITLLKVSFILFMKTPFFMLKFMAFISIKFETLLIFVNDFVVFFFKMRTEFIVVTGFLFT